MIIRNQELLYLSSSQNYLLKIILKGRLDTYREVIFTKVKNQVAFVLQYKSYYKMELGNDGHFSRKWKFNTRSVT